MTDPYLEMPTMSRDEGLAWIVRALMQRTAAQVQAVPPEYRAEALVNTSRYDVAALLSVGLRLEEIEADGRIDTYTGVELRNR